MTIAAKTASRLLSGAGLVLALATRATAGAIAFDDPALQAPASMTVSVAQVQPGGPLPANYTLDGRNISPAVSWTAGPAATRAYVLVMQDPDAPGPQARVHWLVYGLPAQTTLLARGLRNLAELTRPLGVDQGRNDHGSFGYSGPMSAVGETPHHYHFQVFALDRALRVRPGADLALVERAMAGHVLGRGDLVATYVTAPPPRPPGERGSAHRETTVPPS